MVHGVVVWCLQAAVSLGGGWLFVVSIEAVEESDL